jgi:trehalose 6-phosphate phosphatase
MRRSFFSAGATVAPRVRMSARNHSNERTDQSKGSIVFVPMSLPILSKPDSIAFFLDFDGTLVELAERPDAVRLAERTRDAISRLIDATGGAVAVITGREIAELDEMLAPLRLPAAGVHGLTRRTLAGENHAAPIDEEFLRHAELLLAPLVLSEPGLLLERKSNAVALHYRARPDLEVDCGRAMDELASISRGIQIKRGKMVFEAKPALADKGTAILDFLKEAPFAGRRPFFAGDDATDEDAFAAVNKLDGITVKIGPGATIAQYRAEGTPLFLEWLHATSLVFMHEVAND